jgi:hypothetical protein
VKRLLQSIFGASSRPVLVPPLECAAEPGQVRFGAHSFDLAASCEPHEGLPHPDWSPARKWLQDLPDADRPAAWSDCKRAWLLLLADALGADYRVYESAHAFVLSRQPPGEANATLSFAGTTIRRVKQILEELAREGRLGKEVLLLFPDADAYYRYIGAFYPDEGEFPMSAGVYLHGPCGHFVVHGDEMWRFEPTIVHEMTHSMLSHLPIPAWLNEGMAVNSEQRLTRRGDDVWTVRELEEKHRRFWTPENIQQFWNGKAYRRTDDGRKLAYDLGRILVNGLCSDWAGFKRFAAQANKADGGSAAAREQLDLDLGEMVRHFLGAAAGEWGPLPEAWKEPAEEGAFAPAA